MMVVVTVLYPLAGGKKFDADYYLNSHVPWVGELMTPMGMRDIRVHEAVELEPGVLPAFSWVADLYFDTMEELNAALTEHGPATQADIPNFTDSTPIIQISHVR